MDTPQREMNEVEQLEETRKKLEEGRKKHSESLRKIADEIEAGIVQGICYFVTRKDEYPNTSAFMSTGMEILLLAKKTVEEHLSNSGIKIEFLKPEMPDFAKALFNRR